MFQFRVEGAGTQAQVRTPPWTGRPSITGHITCTHWDHVDIALTSHTAFHLRDRGRHWNTERKPTRTWEEQTPQRQWPWPEIDHFFPISIITNNVEWKDVSQGPACICFSSIPLSNNPYAKVAYFRVLFSANLHNLSSSTLDYSVLKIFWPLPFSPQGTVYCCGGHPILTRPHMSCLAFFLPSLTFFFPSLQYCSLFNILCFSCKYYYNTYRTYASIKWSAQWILTDWTHQDNPLPGAPPPHNLPRVTIMLTCNAID